MINYNHILVTLLTLISCVGPFIIGSLLYMCCFDKCITLNNY